MKYSDVLKTTVLSVLSAFTCVTAFACNNDRNAVVQTGMIQEYEETITDSTSVSDTQTQAISDTVITTICTTQTQSVKTTETSQIQTTVSETSEYTQTQTTTELPDIFTKQTTQPAETTIITEQVIRTYDPNLKTGMFEQYLKYRPEELSEEDLSYTYKHYDGLYYEFERSGYIITEDDYVILCNCVANEYGAAWVPEWEMGLVAEVVWNRFNDWGYDSLRSVITARSQFSGSSGYAGLDTFSSKVNDRVINAVNTYLSFPEYFSEGYHSFRGDGTWNYFW